MTTHRLIFLAICLLAAVLSAVATVAEDLPDSLAPILELVEQNYWRPIDRDSLIEIIRGGDLTKLDPYSEILDSLDWAEMNVGLAGSFGGIGAFLDYDSTAHQHFFGGIFLGSPALKAGLRAGDGVLAVDSLPTDSMSTETLLSHLRGPVGTIVTLIIRRDSLATPMTFEITRESIEVTSIRGSGRQSDSAPDYRIDGEPDIAYLRINYFSRTTAHEVDSALAHINASGAKALILDLRDNYGGLMRAAREVADMFLDSGVIVSLEDGKADTSYVATAGTKFTWPVAMLINDGTVSSGEILAAALQDNGRVITIGSRTFGKGLAQDLFALPDSIRGLKLSTAAYIRPSRQPMERHLPGSDTTIGGVLPDSGLEMTASQAELATEYVRVMDADQVWQYAGTTIPLASPKTDSFVAKACEELRKWMK